MIAVIRGAILPPFYFITSQILPFQFGGVSLGAILIVCALSGIAISILRHK